VANIVCGLISDIYCVLGGMTTMTVKDGKSYCGVKPSDGSESLSREHQETTATWVRVLMFPCRVVSFLIDLAFWYIVLLLIITVMSLVVAVV